MPLCINWEAISAIATVIGTIAVIITVLEMKKQRYAAYLPQLLIHSKRFFIGTTPLKRVILWKDSNTTKKSIDDSIEHSPEIFIDIENVGLAAAINVDLSVDYDLERMCKIIDSYNYPYLKKHINEQKNLIVYLYESNGSNDNFWPFNLQAEEPVKFSVLNANVKQQIKLPSTIKNFINIIAVVFHNNDGSYYSLKFEIPAVIHLRYTDISLNDIKKDIAVKVEIIIMNPESNDSFIRGDIYFVAKRRRIHLTIAST